VSLEDDLMRLFGSERIAGIMEKLGIQEGEVLEHRGSTSRSSGRSAAWSSTTSPSASARWSTTT
jgi:preprotein translocase subunit SecA